MSITDLPLESLEIIVSFMAVDSLSACMIAGSQYTNLPELGNLAGYRLQKSLKLVTKHLQSWRRLRVMVNRYILFYVTRSDCREAWKLSVMTHLKLQPRKLRQSAMFFVYGQAIRERYQHRLSDNFTGKLAASLYDEENPIDDSSLMPFIKWVARECSYEDFVIMRAILMEFTVMHMRSANTLSI